MQNVSLTQDGLGAFSAIALLDLVFVQCYSLIMTGLKSVLNTCGSVRSYSIHISKTSVIGKECFITTIFHCISQAMV